MRSLSRHVPSGVPSGPVRWVVYRKSDPRERGAVEAQLWYSAKELAAVKYGWPLTDVDGYREDLGRPMEARA